MDTAIIEPLVRMPWNQPTGLREVRQPGPMTSVAIPGAAPPAEQRGDVMVRIAPGGGLLIHNADHEVVVLAADGTESGRFRLQPPDGPEQRTGWSVLDMAAGVDGTVVFLERLAQGTGFVFGFSSHTLSGQPSWRFPTALTETLGTASLVTSRAGVLVFFDRGGEGEVYRLEPAQRSLVALALGAGVVGRPVETPDGRLMALRRSEDGNLQVLYLDPTKQEAQEGPVWRDHRALRGIIGVRPNGDVLGHAGATVVRFDARGEVLEETRIFNLVHDLPHDHVYLNVLGVLRDRPSGALRKAQVGHDFGPPYVPDFPDAVLQKHDLRNAYLVNVTAEGHLVFKGFDAARQPQLIVYDAGKHEILSVEAAPADLPGREFRLLPPTHWVMDGEGGLYLPVLGPDAFLVLRWK